MASSSQNASILADQYAEINIEGEEEWMLIEDEAEGDELVFDDRWLKSGENPRAIHIHKLDMWVQIHDLRSGFMMDKVVRSAGGYIGTYVKSDPKNFNGIWRDYLRVRATIDIEKPLKRRMKLCKENGGWIWATFKYEHLPTFCFICGIIGHAERFCLKRFEQDFDQAIKPYGIEMKAQMKKKNYLIGAQWLKTRKEDFQPVSGGSSHRSEAEDRSNEMAKIMDVDPMISGSKGREVITAKGNQGSNGVDIVSDNYMGNVTINNNGDKVNLQNNELVIVLENKKRRMDMRVIGGNNEVSSDVENYVEVEKECDVISKVIANRLKGALPDVISNTQSAFLPGRLISDNIMVSYEIMHYLKRKRMGKEGFMALKLDMSKAYDRVGWTFLEAMLVRMGFNNHFVSLIMSCLTTVTYNVTYGGKVMGPINPGRGIRQGDPLSPYLFLVCAEGLSSLLKHYERKNWLMGCQVARGAPRVSHMLFADDSYVYCKANEIEAGRVLQLLQVYQRASGQQVNNAKSSVFFNKNTTDVIRHRMCEVLGMMEALENSFYLGLPCTMGRNKNAILGFLKEKMQKKIFSWESRFLSKAGKEVLIKSVAQALPSYAMSVFLLTEEICSSLEGMMSKFWWKSQSNSSRGVSWMSWKRLCRHKHKGGIGFRDLQDYNLAFLGKQGWRLLTNESSLVSRIYKARYYPNGSFLSATLGHNPSFIWRSLLEAKDLVRSGARRSIGGGNSVSILFDPWLLDDQNPFVSSHHPALEGQLVSSLLSVGSKQWDAEVIDDLFNDRDKNLIFSIQLSETGDLDSWYWSRSPSSFYTVKSAYKTLQHNNCNFITDQQKEGYKQLWQFDIPPKVQHFLWRALSECLPTKIQLNTKHVNVETSCPFCSLAEETIFHILLGCGFSKACWNLSCVSTATIRENDFKLWFFSLLDSQPVDVIREAAMVSWKIWAVRNDVVWNNKSCSALEVVRSARITLDQWSSAQSQKMGVLLVDDINNVKEHWRKPMTNTVKVNVDGAIFQSENKFGFGCVARDSNGALIEAISGSRPGVVKPEVAEIIGIKEALSWIKRKQWIDVALETGSLIAVQALKSSIAMPFQFGLLVRDCQDLVFSLNNISVIFVKQSANKVAHCVARGSCFKSDCTFSEHDAPFALKTIVYAESL
uniref:Reverse transcriptase domain-containing protein n=1 Tax=Cannabis sativa TaxID=3483 RepID=A0A803QJD1_CANSA